MGVAQLNSFEAASLRKLKQKIDLRIADNADGIAGGNCMVLNDADATAQNYSSATAYIRALHDVLELCKEVEDELLRGK